MDKTLLNAIERIKKEDIRPQSKMRSLARRYAKWAMFIVVAFLGALTVSIIQYVIGSLDWDVSAQAGKNPVAYALSIAPYFWIVFFGLFSGLAYWELRNTESGYRYSAGKIIGYVAGVILFFSIVAYFFGMGYKVNERMARSIPMYASHMVVTKESQWMRPSEGFLGGDIQASSEDEMRLRDLNGKEWNIVLSTDTLIRPLAQIEIGSRIKLIGTMRDGDTFVAREIRPWEGKGAGKAGSEAHQNRAKSEQQSHPLNGREAKGQKAQSGSGMGRGMVGR